MLEGKKMDTFIDFINRKYRVGDVFSFQTLSEEISDKIRDIMFKEFPISSKYLLKGED